MAPRRLSDSEKQDLVGRYKAGESTSALAEAFGCSPNTVSRTVKALLPADAYAALKAGRQKGLATPPPPTVTEAEEPEADSVQEDDSSLALDDADDFGDDPDDELAEDDDNGSVKRSRSLFPCLGWEILAIAH